MQQKKKNYEKKNILLIFGSAKKKILLSFDSFLSLFSVISITALLYCCVSHTFFLTHLTPINLYISLGSAPSCSSTPPPAFDDISEHGVSNNQSKNLSNDYRSSSDKRLNSPRSTSYRDDSVR